MINGSVITKNVCKFSQTPVFLGLKLEFPVTHELPAHPLDPETTVIESDDLSIGPASDVFNLHFKNKIKFRKIIVSLTCLYWGGFLYNLEFFPKLLRFSGFTDGVLGKNEKIFDRKSEKERKMYVLNVKH